MHRSSYAEDERDVEQTLTYDLLRVVVAGGGVALIETLDTLECTCIQSLLRRDLHHVPL